MQDSSLSELWSRKAEAERGENFPDHYARLFFDVQLQATEDPELRAPFNALVKSIRRYENAKQSFASAKTEEFKEVEIDKERIKSSDEHLRIAHEALISSLDALSRAFRRSGFNNEWRREIGLDREDAARFADHVFTVLPQLETRH